MKNSKSIYIILALLILTTNTYAYTETVPFVFTSQGTAAETEGGCIKLYWNVTINSISKAQGDTSTTVYVTTAGRVSNLTYANFSGNTAYVNYTLLNTNGASGTEYCFYVWSGGSVATIYGKNPGATFPQSTTSGAFDWISGIMNDAIVSTAFLGIYNITFSNVTFTNIITNATCTSCIPPDNTPPYETDDTTPTFNIITNVASDCRIGNSNITYTAMGSTRNCTHGDSQSNHTCTLSVSDAIVTSNSSIYVTCNSTLNVDVSINLSMFISSLEESPDLEAIQQGIENSIAWPGATVYTNQMMYLRAVNNSQIVWTIDKVVVYGNQRWLFNFANNSETVPNLFNISPIVYVLSMNDTITLSEVRSRVTELINNTRS